MLNEIELDDRDYKHIKDIAEEEWKEKASVSYFLCKLYVKAIISFCARKGYMIRDGKIFKI